MSQLTRSALAARIESILEDSRQKNAEQGDVRALLIDIKDSMLFAADGGVQTQTTVAGVAADEVLTVSGQVQDGAGNDIAGRFIVGIFFGAAANDGTPVDLGTLAKGTGTEIVKALTADAYAEVLTAADGSWEVTLTLGTSDTVHSNAFVAGRVAVTSTEVTVP